MPRGSAQAHQQISGVQTFGTILPDLTIESIRNPDHPKRLFLHIWDGRKYATAPATSDGGRTYTPASIASGLAQGVRFPIASKPFGSATKLAASMFGFLSRYAYLSPDGAWLLVAFALASWFPDCVPVAPVLHLLGPDNEARLVLRLLACISRRPVLLSDIDVPALATLPGQLDPTLLIGQRNLPRSVMRVWWHPMFATFLSRMEMVSFTPMARRLFLPTPNPCPRRACGSAFCQRWIRYRH